ncbi:MAG: DUF6090 family protein [Marinirhabdus sp.]|nr:DUF6090 family protein [Marinirhabdus sp.]
MIKFFRHIRQRLLEENKFSKYLLYAVGEIILVVIGILIALQINNWNSDRIQKTKEEVYLTNVKRDLNEQLVSIEAQLNYELQTIEVATPIITYYKEYQAFKVDSLFTVSIGNLTGRKTFIRNAPTYTELISSGNIDIIRNNEIKDEIIKYYQELERIELIINKNNNLFTDAVFIPEMLGLSEIQIIGELHVDELAYLSDNNISLIDLNESRLKEITKEKLQNADNEIKMINAINFRNFLSTLHASLMKEQHVKTVALLNKLSSND